MIWISSGSYQDWLPVFALLNSKHSLYLGLRFHVEVLAAVYVLLDKTDVAIGVSPSNYGPLNADNSTKSIE